VTLTVDRVEALQQNKHTVAGRLRHHA